MTARQMLEHLREINWTINEIPGKEAKPGMDYKEFAEVHNLVHQHKCCEYCRFGVPGLDGECTCVHPDRLGTGECDVRYNTEATDVCDAWEERTEENEDIQEYNQ